ncbi:UNVERIFIED_CONTAM: hypothetical protein HDU68_008568 [Siphonaria sp. JEL0065]|nr:hypothetical protein HDU68_008568 [Siphonaria sp. JEL0065]
MNVLANNLNRKRPTTAKDNNSAATIKRTRVNESGAKHAPNQSTSTINLNHLLPETPAIKRLRKARPNESLISVNGSPIAPSALNDDADTSTADYSMFQNSICLPSRRITLKSGMPRESFAVSDMSFSGSSSLPTNGFMLNIPLDGGNTVLELDPAQSPTALGGLDEDRKTEVKSQLQKMQDQLQTLLMQIN